MDIDIISYDEDLWMGLPKDRQEHCKAEWLKKATAAGARRVVLRLLPDDLFPMYGHETPYVAWQVDIDRPPECGFTVSSRVTVRVLGDKKYIEPAMRLQITRALEGHKAGTVWEIVNERGDVFEHGRL